MDILEEDIVNNVLTYVVQAFYTNNNIGVVSSFISIEEAMKYCVYLNEENNPKETGISFFDYTIVNLNLNV